MVKDNSISKIRLSKGAYNVWTNFSVSFLVYIIPILLSFMLKPLLYPIITFLLWVGLLSYIRIKKYKNPHYTECLLATYIVAKILFAYTIILIVLNLTSICNYASQIKVYQICYFPILIMAPLLFIVASHVSLKKCDFCKFCVALNGFPSDRNTFGGIQSSEMNRIVKQLSYIGLILSISAWTYYILFFEKDIITRTDLNVFIGIPVIVWILHEAVITIRLYTISIFNKKIFKFSSFKNNETLLRFIVIQDNQIFLSQGNSNKWDTPFISYVNIKKEPKEEDLIRYFISNFNVELDEIRLLYQHYDVSKNCGLKHYVCFIDNSYIPIISGQWIGMKELNTIYNNMECTLRFRNEFYNITNAILTMKTYHLNGKRRNQLKKYKPSFELTDLKAHQLYLTDSIWAKISVHNEDLSCYRLRNFWYKHIEGLID